MKATSSTQTSSALLPATAKSISMIPLGDRPTPDESVSSLQGTEYACQLAFKVRMVLNVLSHSVAPTGQLPPRAGSVPLAVGTQTTSSVLVADLARKERPLQGEAS